MDITAYLWMALGVLISVILPVLSGWVRGQFPRTAAPGIPPWLKKYGGLLVFSLITALVLLAAYRFTGNTGEITWYAALLTGYGWEATLEKLAS